MHCDSDDHQQTRNYFCPEWPSPITLGAEENKACAYNHMVATRRTGAMVLLQHFESKVYENSCNALTAACNALSCDFRAHHALCIGTNAGRFVYNKTS